MMDFKTQVKKLCKEKNIKLQDIAKRINMDKAALSRAISGNPTLKTMESIAMALGVSISDLLRYKDRVQGNITIDNKEYLLIEIKK